MTDDATLDAYLTGSAARYPSRTAVVDGIGMSLTYRQLHDLADDVAEFLRAQGIRAGDRVGLVTGKRCAVLAVMVGVLRTGAAYVPLDSASGTTRLAQILADAAPGFVCCDAEALDRLRHEGIVAPDAGSVTVPGTALRWARVATVGRDPGPAGLAFLLYTSGSTGRPKGVRITHRNARAFVDWAGDEFALTADDRVAGFAPAHFDLSVFDIFATLRAGATLYLVPEPVTAGPRHMPEFLRRHAITVWYSTPSVLGLAVARPPIAGPDPLRLVLFAGEPFPVPALRRLTARWPAAAYYNLYGPTETNVCTFARVPTPLPDDRKDPYPIGHACPHCELLVVGPDNRPVAPGAAGLLCVAGPSVTPGYWGRADDPAFFEHAGRRWYNTGDVVCPGPDGLVFRGRRDRMVKRSGHRIELDEIEAALVRCPGVRYAAVVADTAANPVVITAFVVAAGDATGQLPLRRFCRRELGAHLVPDRFRHLPRLPRTASGKTDYQRLLAC